MATHKVSRKVNDHLVGSIPKVMAKMRSANEKYGFYCDKKHKAIYVVNTKDNDRFDPTRYDFLGVYDKNIPTKELRSDLLWYIENCMEDAQ